MGRYTDIIDNSREFWENNERITCMMKEVYESREEALEARWKGAPYVYQCRWCGKWHLTSGKGRKESEE